MITTVNHSIVAKPYYRIEVSNCVAEGKSYISVILEMKILKIVAMYDAALSKTKSSTTKTQWANYRAYYSALAARLQLLNIG